MRETAQPDEPMDRDFLAQSVNIQAHRHIPILYSMTNVGDFADNEEKIVYKEDPTIENNINDNFATRKIDSNNHQKNKSNSVTKVTATPSNQVKQTIVPIDDSDDDESSDGFFEIKGI
ncbi:hypothetical protein TRFO_34543 [Tritrichomonas foetus]|uniref:Uncharacterized protein n=1 Tax=Tritrichomonas foetus TaxID=1144522 RepID=A0A1J4JP97_9EUKA|nr:hypothetical protein TRFO_34543 [Tritrichomonas foetus]|eukprot:OHS99100.1 hypothetical protein TRFO_34543 [Tritrichomonas foetus]